MTDYVRVKFNNTIKAPVWAVKRATEGETVIYTRCTKEGETCPDSTISVIIASPGDVAWEKPARLNLHYGELECQE